jgi:hypothetical protein
MLAHSPGRITDMNMQEKRLLLMQQCGCVIWGFDILRLLTFKVEV